MAECKRLKQAYATAVVRFFDIGYLLTDAEHRNLKNSVEEARALSESIRFELQKHQRSVHAKSA